jgi:hypothetical protein
MNNQDQAEHAMGWMFVHRDATPANAIDMEYGLKLLNAVADPYRTATHDADEAWDHIDWDLNFNVQENVFANLYRNPNVIPLAHDLNLNVAQNNQ